MNNPYFVRIKKGVSNEWVMKISLKNFIGKIKTAVTKKMCS